MQVARGDVINKTIFLSNVAAEKAKTEKEKNGYSKLNRVARAEAYQKFDMAKVTKQNSQILINFYI